MNHLKFLLVILFLSSGSTYAQNNVNNYKYLIVPVRYDFQKSDDQFQVNSLTKFLFEKEGFQVFLSDEEFPDELKLNRCLSLTARLNDNSKLFSTKMNFDLLDCGNKVVFTAVEGRSKSKDYKTAYHESIRESFESFKELNYKYEPEAEVLESVAVVEKPVPDSNVSSGVETTTKPNKKVNNTVVVPAVTSAVIVQKEVKKEPVIPETETKQESVKVISDVLYAQPNTNGYQVVDSTPKVVYILLKTKVKDVFLVKDQSATVYKENGTWKLEYYENGKSIVKELNIKFF